MANVNLKSPGLIRTVSPGLSKSCLRKFYCMKMGRGFPVFCQL